MTRVEQGRTFVEGVLGRTWDNFASRVAATYYHGHFLHGTIPISDEFKEKLLRLISKDELAEVVAAHEKLGVHDF